MGWVSLEQKGANSQCKYTGEQTEVEPLHFLSVPPSHDVGSAMGLHRTPPTRASSAERRADDVSTLASATRQREADALYPLLEEALSKSLHRTTMKDR